MPQMAPISWLTLFIMFSLTLIIFNAMNYYSYPPKLPKMNKQLSLSQTPLNWKW